MARFTVGATLLRWDFRARYGDGRVYRRRDSVAVEAFLRSTEIGNHSFLLPRFIRGWTAFNAVTLSQCRAEVDRAAVADGCRCSGDRADDSLLQA